MTHAQRRCLHGSVCFVFPFWLFWFSIAGATRSEVPAPLASLVLPGSTGTLRVEATGGLTLSTPGGTSSIAQLTNEGERLAAATLRTVVVDGQPLIEVRASLRRGAGRVTVLRAAATPSVLLTEPFGADPDGERSRSVMLDARGIWRSQTTPAVTRCDSAQPLFLQRYDLAASSWIGVPGHVPTAARVASRAPAQPAVARHTLRFSSASVEGSIDRADRLAAPRELDDGNDATSYDFGKNVRGAFVSAIASHPVDTLAIRVAPPPAPSRLPLALVVIAGTPPKPVARLELGAGAGPRWFSLQTAPVGSCVSLVLDDTENSESAIAIGEITLFTSDDRPEGLATLAGRVAADGEDAEGSAHTLEQAGVPGAQAALRALRDAQGPGRRRLLQVVATQGKAVMPAAASQLGTVLETAHADERTIVLKLLGLDAVAGSVEARRILDDHTQAGEAHRDALAILIAIGSANDDAAAQVLDLAESSDELAPDARRALAAQLPTSLTPRIVRELEALSDGAPDAAGQARVATLLVLAGKLPTELRARAVAAITRLASRPQPFEIAVRALSALGRLDAQAATSLASRTLSTSTDPTLRLHALDVLRSPPDAGATMVLTSATKDADARVRQRALTRLVPLLSLSAAVFHERADDEWPQVRQVAYDGLGLACARAPTEATLLNERVFGKKHEADPRARAAALVALSRCPQVTADVIASAIAKKQPSEVRERAAQLLGTGGPAVLPLLARALDRAFQNSSELPDTAVAVLGAIGRVGARAQGRLDDQTLTVLRDSAADPFFPAIRSAALGALAMSCPVGARVVFDRADQDAEPAVQRAAALARARCPR